MIFLNPISMIILCFLSYQSQNYHPPEFYQHFFSQPNPERNGFVGSIRKGGCDKWWWNKDEWIEEIFEGGRLEF